MTSLRTLIPDAALDARDGERDVSCVTADSRAAKPGVVFFAVPGTKADGLDFAPAAAASVMGWTCFAVGIVEYYAVAFLSAGALRRATAR